MTDTFRQGLAAVLEWTLAMGADAFVADEATDWLAPDRAPPGAGYALHEEDVPPRPDSGAGLAMQTAPSAGMPATQRAGPSAQRASPLSVAPAMPRTFATAAPDVAVGKARAEARQAATLDALQRALQSFDGCSLKATAKSLCFYRGAPAAPLMIVGEAPGRDEDMAGQPFVGRAGQLLDRMLAAAGFGDGDVHITNIVYWRPPGNRTPTPQEAEVCRPFLERQIELVAPRVLLLLGGAAAKHIFRTEEGILRLRGRWQTVQFAGVEVPAVASLHPAYLLRTPIAKRQAWRDLLAVREALCAAKPAP